MFDLRSAYHHIDIHKDSQKFLGFEWVGKWFVFTVLPFGLSTACYVFTKVLRPLVRSQGIRVVLYIDDGIVLASSEVEGNAMSNIVQDTLEQTGFLCHPDKCNWTPAQVGCWLGFQLNLGVGAISIPGEKIHALKQELVAVKQSWFVPARRLASIVGKIIAMGMGLGQI